MNVWEFCDAHPVLAWFLALFATCVLVAVANSFRGRKTVIRCGNVCAECKKKAKGKP